MIKIKIDVKKIDKSALFVGEKGTYLELILNERPDDFGNDGYVAQDIGQTRRKAGEKGPILGNFRDIQTNFQRPESQQKPTQRTPTADNTIQDDDIPF